MAKQSVVIQRIFIVVATLVFLGSFIIAYMNTAKVEGLFFTSNGYVDDKYYQELSPDGVAFSIIWPIIYTWNLATVIYIVVSIWLPENKSPVKINPSLIPTSFLVFHSLGFGLTLAWLFAFDAEILSLSLCALASSAISFYFAVGISYKRVYDNLHMLEKKENKVMLWVVRILVQNGLCLPATWLTIATCLNTTDVIIYEDSFGIMPPVMRGTLNVEDASTVMLSVLFAAIISWSLLDNFILQKYTQYTFTVFPVLILGLSGLVAKLRLVENNRNLIFACVVLGFSVCAFVFRVFLFVYRIKNKRRIVEDESIVMENQSSTAEKF